MQRYLLNFFIMDNKWNLMRVRWWAEYTLLSCVCKKNHVCKTPAEVWDYTL